MSSYQVQKISDEKDRQAALQVFCEVYQEEKGWIPELEVMFPKSDLGTEACSWFIVYHHTRPVGAVRVLYELPLELYRTYDFNPVDPNFDLAGFVMNNRIAEIGRFAVLAPYRKKFLAAASLMKAAVMDTFERGFTHYITDVFENEATSPFQFHTRVLGFETVATHELGEFNCNNRRVTLVLDLPRAMRRLKHKGAWIYRYIIGDWNPQIALHDNKVSKPQPA